MIDDTTVRRLALLLALLLGGATAPARADFSYAVTINLSGLSDSNGAPLSGSPGYLDIQFNPTGGTETLFATVQGRTSNNTLLGAVSSTQGDVTGPGGSLPVSGLPLTFASNYPNGFVINDAVLEVTFGTTLALSLDITTADASSTASFFLFLYDQYGSPISSISDPSDPFDPNANPSAVQLDLIANPSGGSPIVNPPLLGSAADAQPEAVATPAPPSAILLGMAVVCVAGHQLVRKKRLPVMA